MRLIFVFVILIVFSAAGAAAIGNKAENKYVGQTPPGLAPIKFAPDIFSESNYREYVFSIAPGDNVCVFDRHGDGGFPDGEIFISKIEDGKWSEPRLFGLFENHEHIFLPTISPDGKRWFFTSNSVQPPPGVNGKIPLYYIEKTGEGWSEPKYIGQGIHASATNDGTLYYMVEGRDWGRPAFRKLADGSYMDYQFIEPAEYFTDDDAHLVVDPQGRYIIFDSESRSRIGECGLFISFQEGNNLWSRPVSMGKVIKQRAALAWINYDGKYIFFKSGDDVWWVDAKIVELF